MDRQFAVRPALASALAARTWVPLAGIVVVVAAFGWFAGIAPPAVSFAIAVAAAWAWCAWLETHSEAPVDVARRDVVAAATRAGWSVYVLATTRDGTTSALTVAKHLTSGLDGKVVLLVPHVGSPVAGSDSESAEPAALVDEHDALAAEVGVRAGVVCCVCHRPDDIVRQMVGRASLLIVGGRKRIWWPTREERLVDRLAREGYPVVFARVDSLSPL
jgi:hypothetical protein